MKKSMGEILQDSSDTSWIRFMNPSCTVPIQFHFLDQIITHQTALTHHTCQSFRFHVMETCRSDSTFSCSVG